MTKLDLALLLVGILAIVNLGTYAWGKCILSERSCKLQREVSQRICAWWVMITFFLLAWWCGFFAMVLLFFVISTLALVEYLTLLHMDKADHRAALSAFIIMTPLQYFLLSLHWYGLFSIFIPVYGFLLLMTQMALSGNCEHFLERVAKFHCGLMICVFLLSFAPALLTLTLIGFENRPELLLFYLVVLTELSDILQFVFGKALGRHKVAPGVSPNKTVEGLIGGMLGTGMCALALGGLTPFPIWLDFVVGVLICLFGFCGGLCMSAIKRDHGRKDFGTLIAGHGGMLDRVDSLCFTAPLFFHFVRYFYCV